MGWQDGTPVAATQIPVVNPREAELLKTGFTADGHTAPPAVMVDTQGHAPPAWMQGTPVATPPPFKQDAIGAANEAAEKGEHGPVQDVIDMLHSAATSIGPQIKALVTKGIDPDAAVDQVAHGLRTFLQNPETATPQVVGQNVVAPALLG